MNNVFEKLALYRRHGADTSPVSNCLEEFLKKCDIILKFQQAAESLFIRHLNNYNNKGASYTLN